MNPIKKLRALANENRLELLRFLLNDVVSATASAAAKHLKCSRPAACQYLRDLEEARLVRCNRMTKTSFYLAVDTDTESFLNELHSFFLSAF